MVRFSCFKYNKKFSLKGISNENYVIRSIPLLDGTLSNSLVIHEPKTKEINI